MTQTPPATHQRPPDEVPRGLYAREPRPRLDARREVKINLPMQQLIQLYAVKLRTGATISSTVEAALETYIANLRDQQRGGPAPPGPRR